MNIQPIILCGGSGTRLWPLSREKHPKQFLSLLDTQTLLQATLTRLHKLSPDTMEPPLFVSHEEYRFVVAEQMRALGISSPILLEPIARNTAPALTLAALRAIEKGQDPILLVMPSDHALSDTAAFHAAAQHAIAEARQGRIVTFGIRPTFAATGYGYIQATAHGISPAIPILRFVEKPNAATAEAFLQEGSYYWNSGIFVMQASVWLAAIGTCQPAILSACQNAWAQRRGDGDFIRVPEAAFAACPSESIDYAVMEHLGSANTAHTLPAGALVPLDAGWSDVGTWDALWSISDKDPQGNVTHGDVLLQDCENTLAYASSRLLACSGVNDLVIVETPDAVMVIHKSEAQKIKNIVEQLKQQKRPETNQHRKVHRPWGWYDSIDNGTRFQVKHIVVKPHGILSLQMHHHRAEHWIVVSGTARITRGEESFLLTENQSTFIPLGITHRLENPGHIPLEMIEVQSGAYLGEDDIVRFEDSYGR